ncbi:MAG: Nucleoside-diphosphate-sugar epimerase [Labilithrix sp.]|nr:Nucleoside-diphosphate-sugar epimerase [Labilithrix sp.]
MKILIAGATGAIGRQLVPLLVRKGHEVTAIARSAESGQLSRRLGAEPVAADLLDRDSVLDVVDDAAPDVIVHEATSLPATMDMRHLDKTFAATNDLRVRGTDNLVEAAERTGVRQLVAQSFAGWPYGRTGGEVKTEEDELDPHPPAKLHSTIEAIRYLEHAVLSAHGVRGVVLRYGAFYGPGTSIATGGGVVEAVRAQQIPIVGKGRGMWSFVHVADAARATVAAIEREATGIYNIVDDEPARMGDWLRELARDLNAKPPVWIPRWLARLAMGNAAVVMMTEARAASNAKALRDLEWRPSIPTWREGFAQLRQPPEELIAQRAT